MGGKHCCYGTCNSDSRYADRPHMNGVFFIPFPKPKTNLEKCKIWIKNCGRKDFGIDRISRNTYVCSKHFVGEKGPTNDHPHPVPAAASDLERRIATKVVRPPPRDRSASLPPCKKQKQNDVECNDQELDPHQDPVEYAFTDQGKLMS